jgi:AcrR family transcriptional regulator
VTTTAEKATERISRRQVDKFAERRDQLAAAALQTLSELGYARTSLREIAQNSEFSHGVLHYYFTDKVDLITHCVRQYKAHCVTRYDQIVATARTPAELEAGFAAGLAETLQDEAPMHRLWYDLRAQSLFEESFRADVAEIDASLERMIWRIVSKYAELSGATLHITAPVMYAVFDGLFQQSLLRFLAGEPTAVIELQAGVKQVLDQLIAH